MDKPANKESKRHHVVPQSYLRAWTDEAGLLQVIDVEPRRTFQASTANVAVYSRFFTFDTTDGPTDEVERMLSELETRAAPILVRLAGGDWPLEDDDRAVVAELLTIQIARRPSFRVLQTTAIQQVYRMAGKMMAAHPDALAGRLSQEQGRAPTQDEVDAVARHLSSDFDVTVPRNHWLGVMAIVADLVNPIFDMQWTRLDVGHGEFLTTDEPFVPWKDPEAPAWTSAGLFTAECHTFPVSPRYCLRLRFLFEGDDLLRNPGDVSESVGRGAVAEINQTSVDHAFRHVVMRVGFDRSNLSA